MATMTKNGVTENISVEELAQLFSIATAQPAPEPPKPAKADKPAETKAQAKAAKIRREHDAILDSKRVQRMAKTATDALSKQGFAVHRTGNRGSWVWIYPAKNRAECHKYVEKHPDYKAAKLAKGWKYSIKRGAFYRDFS